MALTMFLFWSDLGLESLSQTSLILDQFELSSSDSEDEGSVSDCEDGDISLRFFFLEVFPLLELLGSDSVSDWSDEDDSLLLFLDFLFSPLRFFSPLSFCLFFFLLSRWSSLGFCRTSTSEFRFSSCLMFLARWLEDVLERHSIRLYNNHRFVEVK